MPSPSQSPLIFCETICLPSRLPIAYDHEPWTAPPLPQTVTPHGSVCEKTPRPYLVSRMQPAPSVATEVNISRLLAGR
jgi:hypothetical protein